LFLLKNLLNKHTKSLKKKTVTRPIIVDEVMEHIQMDLVFFEAYEKDNEGAIGIQTIKD
jgi:hypothetical protein